MKESAEIEEIKGCLRDMAFKNSDTKGRNKPEEDEITKMLDKIDPYAVDIQKIKNSKSFRRLNGKTQVFAFPENVLIRNRLTHTLEVESIAETIATILGLNVNLVRAISLAHDLGHTPFGHLGERFLQKNFDPKFHHKFFGVTVAEKIERKGEGLNLSAEVLEGIIHHSRGEEKISLKENLPMEYNVVMLADKIAYLFSDINDVERLERFKEPLPEELLLLGKNQRERVDSCIMAICLESYQKRKISFSDSKESQIFNLLRDWMMQNFYKVMDEEKERGVLWEKAKSATQLLEKDLFIDPKNISSVFAIMTDDEVYQLSKINDNHTKIGDFKKISKMGFYETLSCCPELNFNYGRLLR